MGFAHQQIIDALTQAFSAGQTYLPIERIGKFLDDAASESLTKEDIIAACEESGQFRLKGKFIVRT